MLLCRMCTVSKFKSMVPVPFEVCLECGFCNYVAPAQWEIKNPQLAVGCVLTLRLGAHPLKGKTRESVFFLCQAALCLNSHTHTHTHTHTCTHTHTHTHTH